MSELNENLKNIKIIDFAIFIVLAYVIFFILSCFNIVNDSSLFYILIIAYFVFSLRNCTEGLKEDVKNVFSKMHLRYILLIVFLNIFFSYGMLYVSVALINNFPSLDFLVNFSIPSMSIDYLPMVGSFLTTVVVSPISEELLFRGVFLNKFKLFIPTVFAVLITSLLFGALHSFGGMISAFVFAICMAILYLKTENIFVPIFAHFLNNLFAEIIRLSDVNNILFTNYFVMGFVGVLAIISTWLLLSSIIEELKKY
ncbi:CPBP family intramembrane glutamic endopeptidase [Methanobrevibacter sp.]|uniref:CPBP family intramembrane glutamic endopeptidase n=1 Tax=Methanobrevibacter sp. TaxID=66852 RepID=UPI0025F24F78|nr:type II CAAX endopeptidase family protein [Methanobrevibacter sp.]MBQ2832733.1 CPBP family intramembrane metalloprotease [Methanobrevibacter sp.]